MSYTRRCAPIGQTVTLRALFVDPCGNPVDIDEGTLTSYIYDDGDYDFSTITNSDNYSSAIEAITSVTSISTGYYEVSYIIPSSLTEEVRWRDLWVAEIGGVKTYNVFNINIKLAGAVKLQIINNNTLIAIVIDSTVADTSGNTLEEDQQATFSTRYTPYYASPDLIRLEAGQWVESIPNDTLSLFIHWASLEADAIATKVVNSNIFNMARTKFVIHDVLLRVLTLPVGLGGKQKKLGDLMIRKDSSFADVIPTLKKEREEWFRVVNSGGRIVPGQGFAPVTALKGKFDPNQRRVGRLWHSPFDVAYKQPAANSKFKKLNQTKFRKGFVDFILDGKEID